jgi:hypothetical protein
MPAVPREQKLNTMHSSDRDMSGICLRSRRQSQYLNELPG